MPRAAPAPFRAAFVAASLALLLAGCATSSKPDEPLSTPGWEKHRLLNGPAPYPRLLVEIDSVAGAEPTPAELAALRAFLAAHVDKPAGIELRVDPPIPRAAAAGRSDAALTLAHLSGPADDHSAFLYVLFRRSSRLGLFPRPTNPYYTYFPYPNAVYLDRAYPRFAPFYRTTLRSALLLHELGHALGLAREPRHSDRGHCTRDGCLMRPHIVFNVRRFLTFRPPLENTVLCADCRADLARFRSEAPSATDRHWRGYHRRNGTGYTVLTLPAFHYVQFGDFADLDPAHLAAQRRDSLDAKLAGDTNVHLYVRDFSPARHAAALRHLWLENNLAEFRHFAADLVVRALDLAEQALPSAPEEARAMLNPDLAALLDHLPSHRPRFEAIRARLPAPPAASP